MENAAVYRPPGRNAWQVERYAFMAGYNQRHGVVRFGRSLGGQPYLHLLRTEDALHNFLGEQSILDAVHRRFGSHKAGDLNRVLTNTVASTPCCFNLFVPLQRDLRLASEVCSVWVGKRVDVAHVEIEFTPNRCDAVPEFERHDDESLGDQSGDAGTDADVALFFHDVSGKRGVVLVEMKYIEDGFSRCSSYKKKKAIRPTCNASGYHARLIAPYVDRNPARPDCGYLRYANWSLTAASPMFEAHAITSAAGCPFRGSCQQLWRNMLLTERIAAARRLDEYHFFVLSPAENTVLWTEDGRDVEDDMHAVLTPFGRSLFRRIELRADAVDVLKRHVRDEQITWLSKFEERYLRSPAS